MANILTNKNICAINEIGQVVWLECYFDGHTSLQPYMFDIDWTQKPTMTNARDEFYNLEKSDIKEHIIKSFGTHWNDKRYRWWDSKPDDKIRKNCNEWEYINE